MTVSARRIASTIILGALTLGGLATATPAAARSHHHHIIHRHACHGAHCHAARRGREQVLQAQEHLANLGYYHNTPDGVEGPQTRGALLAFQHEHYLRQTGTVDAETLNALVAADNLSSADALNAAIARANPPVQHPDPYGYVNPQYADVMQTAPNVTGAGGTTRVQTLPTRWGHVELTDNGNHGYTVLLDGQPIMQADGQSSVIGVSRSYDLDNEDVIVLSAFRDDDPVCAYNTYLLVINGNGHSVQNVGSCSRGYQAEARHNALYITFPQTDSNSAIGSTFRYENGRLYKL